MVNTRISGLMVYYYFVCKKKLWLHYKGITLEDDNENVKLGRYVDENTYSSERKHIMINGEINVDFVRNNKVLHEIKKSRKIEAASIWQVKYYLYYIKKYGIDDFKAKIDYPLLKQSIDIDLSEEDEKRIEIVLDDISRIINSEECPTLIEKSICKKCAFYDFCFS